MTPTRDGVVHGALEFGWEGRDGPDAKPVGEARVGGEVAQIVGGPEVASIGSGVRDVALRHEVVHVSQRRLGRVRDVFDGHDVPCARRGNSAAMDCAEREALVVVGCGGERNRVLALEDSEGEDGGVRLEGRQGVCWRAAEEADLRRNAVGEAVVLD